MRVIYYCSLSWFWELAGLSWGILTQGLSGGCSHVAAGAGIISEASLPLVWGLSWEDSELGSSASSSLYMVSHVVSPAWWLLSSWTPYKVAQCFKDSSPKWEESSVVAVLPASHTVWLLLHPYYQVHHKGLPSFKGRVHRIQLLKSQGRDSGRASWTRHAVAAIFVKSATSTQEYLGWRWGARIVL